MSKVSYFVHLTFLQKCFIQKTLAFEMRKYTLDSLLMLCKFSTYLLNQRITFLLKVLSIITKKVQKQISADQSYSLPQIIIIIIRRRRRIAKLVS